MSVRRGRGRWRRRREATRHHSVKRENTVSILKAATGATVCTRHQKHKLCDISSIPCSNQIAIARARRGVLGLGLPSARRAVPVTTLRNSTSVKVCKECLVNNNKSGDGVEL